MRKLLQINSVINSGSTGRIAEDIGNLAMEQGWKSYIAYGRNDRDSKSIKINIGSKVGILWHVFLTRFFDLHGFGSKKATRKLLKKIEEIKPDIIHLHNIHGYYLNIEVLFNYLSNKNIPVVWTLHDCWSITGHGAHFEEKINRGNKLVGVAPKAEYPQNWFYSNSLYNYRKKNELFTSIKNMTLVPVSGWLQSVLKDSFFVNTRTMVIYNGIDIGIFKKRIVVNGVIKHYKQDNKKVLLGVANVWTKKKGWADFIQLSKSLKEDEMVVLIGVPEKVINKLPKNIIGIKKTENIEELVEWYSVATIYLNLTYEDNFPTTNIEALACGTPVITYRTGGSPEAISTDTGFVISQGDMVGLRSAIDIIKSNGKEYYTIACRERAEKLYDKNERYQEYIDLYGKLLNLGARV